jgi:hypothetical protein
MPCAPLGLALAALTAPAGPGEGPWDEVVQPFVEAHCFACHDADEATAEVVLDGGLASLDADPRTWKKALAELVAGGMPPKGAERPAPEEVDAVAAALRAMIAEREVDPGQAPVLRRLTRREWRNSVEALFAIDAPEADAFPDDEVAAGFDNVGAVLATTEVHLEKQLLAAERVAARVVQDEDPPAPRIRRANGGEGPKAGHHAPRGAERVIFSNGAWGFEERLPREGEYAIRVAWRPQQAGPDAVRAELRLGARVLDAARLEGAGERVHEWRGRLPAGRARVAAAFANDYFEPAEPAADGKPGRPAQDRNLVVLWLEIEGPLDPQSFGAWQSARLRVEPRPSFEQCVRGLLREAWRRPPTEAEVERVRDACDPSASLEERARTAIVAALASPHFLYKVERAAKAGLSRELDSHELATRLSYYLLGAPPDMELARAADEDALSAPGALERQARRLLDSPRAAGFVEDWAEQWLSLRALEHHRPDPALGSAWDDALAWSAREETIALVLRVLRDRAPARELLESRTTSLDAALAAHYGVDAPPGSRGRFEHRFDDDSRRGLLGHASILALTSRPGRTSPVLRGKWVLEALLGTPPPAPPPGVGALEDVVSAEAASLREKLELHRSKPECAACHAALDPLGFGLERYDALGRRRATDEGFPIDDEGVLPDGRVFRGPDGLRALILADERFEAALFEKLFTYANGRVAEDADRREMAVELARIGPRPPLAELVLGVCRLPSFTRRVERGTMGGRGR